MAEVFCAYCGAANPKSRDHVVPKGLFAGVVQRGALSRPLITVPACVSCNSNWSRDEPYFRNILMLCGSPNSEVMVLWQGKVRRSLEHSDGRKQACDLFAALVPVGRRHVVYPARDARFMRIVSKVVRGLSHHHNIRSTIPEGQVWCDILTAPIPEEIECELAWHVVADGVFSYAVEIAEGEQEAVWLLKFFDKAPFIGIVSRR